jgi:CHAD domain-containing protein
VRDIDVQIERLAAHRERVAAEQAEALAPLADELLRRRAHARAALLAMLASGAYATFVSDYRSFVETPATPDAGTDGPAASVSRVRDVVGGRTWRAYERVLVHDATLQWADVAELHALRIDGKRLRYTLEFFDEILGPGAAKAIELVTQLQDHLGALNDAHIAADLVRAWLVRSAVRLSAAQRQAAGAYVEASLRDGERLRRGFRALWRRLAGPQFRRRLALTVAVA